MQPDQLQDVLSKANQTGSIASWSEIEKKSYSYTTSWKSYFISLSDPGRSYVLLTCTPGDDPAPPLLSFAALSKLLTKILETTAVPVPQPIAHDVEGTLPFGWLLLRAPDSSQTSLASVRDRLTPIQLARIELRLGTHLCALHEITNDWFGMPSENPPPDLFSMPSLTDMFSTKQVGENGEGYGNGEEMIPYSWQDTFVSRLEELLEYVCGDAEARKTAPFSCMTDVDVDALRRALSRAIGAFLFDDIEVPRLVWLTGNEEDVIVSLPADAEADVAYILPTFARAMWGDPLLEAWFLPPGPSPALDQGYFGGEDGRLIMLPRHKTKRVWYTVYLALIVLAEARKGEPDGETTRWAKSVLVEGVQILRDAPCY